MNVIGDVQGRVCVIADDIIDTAGTIQKAAQALKDNGATRVLATAVHGVLSGPAIKRLESAPIDKLVVTNTIPTNGDKAASEKIWCSPSRGCLRRRSGAFTKRHRYRSCLCDKREMQWKPHWKPPRDISSAGTKPVACARGDRSLPSSMAVRPQDDRFRSIQRLCPRSCIPIPA